MTIDSGIELLENFVLDNPELDKLENLLSQFNIFETLNIVSAEIRHSNVLAWLLNPYENHGLGGYFVKQFLKYLISRNKDYLDPKISLFDFEIFNYTTIEIRREWQNIDILIIFEPDEAEYVIAIENKISTGEHSDQLQRYRNIVEKEFDTFNKIYVYLTPEELIPSDENWITFNYTIIADLIDELIQHKKNNLSDNVMNFISHYKTILRRYIVGNSEIEQICTKIYKKHQRALDLIFQYKPDLVSKLNEHIQSILRQKENIIMDLGNRTYVRFTTSTFNDKVKNVGDGWTSTKRILLFEFDIRESRLVVKLVIGPGEQDYRQRLIEFCKKNGSLFKLADRAYIGKKWHTVYQMGFLKKRDFEDATEEDLLELVNQRFKTFLNEINEINEYFQNNWVE